MDATQQTAARWREVVFGGDVFRLPPVRPLATRNAEMHWHYFAESFFHLCRLPAAQGAGLPVRLAWFSDQARQDVRSFYASEARLRGLHAAYAPIIAFADADEALVGTETLARNLDLMQERDAALFHFRSYFASEKRC